MDAGVPQRGLEHPIANGLALELHVEIGIVDAPGQVFERGEDDRLSRAQGEVADLAVVKEPLELAEGRVEDRLPARTSIDETIDDGETRFGFRASSVAGHTEGSVLLLHEASGALFSGDAIIAGPPVQRLFTRLRFAVPEYSLDVEGCARRARAFLADDPPVRTLCAGHGPMLRDPGPSLARLRASS